MFTAVEPDDVTRADRNASTGWWNGSDLGSSGVSAG